MHVVIIEVHALNQCDGTTLKRRGMAKILDCRDIGFDCEGVIRADTEEEVLQQAAEHARTVHNLQDINEATTQKFRDASQDE